MIPEKGSSRTGREYLHLAGMLTENLLKLDSKDTGGQDNIKITQGEANRCVHKCISVSRMQSGILICDNATYLTLPLPAAQKAYF